MCIGVFFRILRVSFALFSLDMMCHWFVGSDVYSSANECFVRVVRVISVSQGLFACCMVSFDFMFHFFMDSICSRANMGVFCVL